MAFISQEAVQVKCCRCEVLAGGTQNCELAAEKYPGDSGEGVRSWLRVMPREQLWC